MRRTVRVGILYSETGPYSAIGRDCRDGADMAIAEIAADAGLPVIIEPVHADPGGDPRHYLEAAREMLRSDGCRHIIGTITSLARKEVIPLVEKHDGLLWYICPYEGFEANENVIYTGACPNQHLIPLFDHLLPTAGNRAYLVGANYVWGWEMNRLARELIVRAGGTILGERYLPIEDREVDRIVADIEAKRPDFILNNLVGSSSYAFLDAITALGERDAAFRSDRCPVVSCDLAECDLGQLGPGSAVGQFSTGPYFDTLPTEANRDFKARVVERHGGDRRISVFFEGAYTAMRMLADAVASAGSDGPAEVKQALYGATFATPHGALAIDPRTNHAALPFHLGRILADGGFEIVLSRPAIVADPYLTFDRTAATRPMLRVVS